MGSCIEKKVGRAQGHSEVPLSSSRALPMSPGLPASKFLALALRHHPTCREDQGMKRPLVRGLAWIARLSICSRYLVACRTM